jgi:hypothetical protein
LEGWRRVRGIQWRRAEEGVDRLTVEAEAGRMVLVGRAVGSRSTSEKFEYISYDKELFSKMSQVA